MLFAKIFRAIQFDLVPTIGDVIREAGWGSNRDIRQKGFRIDEEFSEDSPFFSRTIKEMERVTDPRREIHNQTAVVTPKGTSVVVILVKEEQ